MTSFRIEGGRKLSGEVMVGGNKNAALPIIAASLLTDQEVTLKNVPDILDVRVMLEILSSLGADVSFEKNGDLRIKASSVNSHEISKELCSRVRTSFLFCAPLLYRTGRCVIWPPGGDFIGRRRLDAHFYGLKSLGAELSVEGFPFSFSRSGRLRGRDLFLDEASVTATEHILMAAVLAEGRTVIRNAASEPHVKSLAEFLNKMGAKISGLDSNTLYIDGVESLHSAEHTIEGDHIEAGSFLALAAATGSSIRINGTSPRNYWMTRRVFERLGVEMTLNPDHIYFPGGQTMVVEPDYGNAVPIISDGPWPQLPTDMMSCLIVAATQAKGTVMFFEKMFESRIYFVDRLIMMGANAIVCDPHRVVISGPALLRGSEMSSPDIRAGMAMVIAALCAEGTSVIHNADMILRGYDGLAGKISSLGGSIEKI